MFFFTRQRKLKKALVNLQNSSSTSIKLNVTEKEIDRLARKKQFKDLIFASNPYQYGEIKTYTVFKQ